MKHNANDTCKSRGSDISKCIIINPDHSNNIIKKKNSFVLTTNFRDSTTGSKDDNANIVIDFTHCSLWMFLQGYRHQHHHQQQHHHHHHQHQQRQHHHKEHEEQDDELLRFQQQVQRLRIYQRRKKEQQQQQSKNTVLLQRLLTLLLCFVVGATSTSSSSSSSSYVSSSTIGLNQNRQRRQEHHHDCLQKFGCSQSCTNRLHSVSFVSPPIITETRPNGQRTDKTYKCKRQLYTCNNYHNHNHNHKQQQRIHQPALLSLYTNSFIKQKRSRFLLFSSLLLLSSSSSSSSNEVLDDKKMQKKDDEDNTNNNNNNNNTNNNNRNWMETTNSLPSVERTSSASLPLTTGTSSSGTGSTTSSTNSSNNNNNNKKNTVEWYRSEANRIRRIAEKMEMELVLQKIQTLENKFNNKVWVSKQTIQDIESIEQQMDALQKRLFPTSSNNSTSTTSTSTRYSNTNSNSSDSGSGSSSGSGSGSVSTPTEDGVISDDNIAKCKADKIDDDIATTKTTKSLWPGTVQSNSGKSTMTTMQPASTISSVKTPTEVPAVRAVSTTTTTATATATATNPIINGDNGVVVSTNNKKDTIQMIPGVTITKKKKTNAAAAATGSSSSGGGGGGGGLEDTTIVITLDADSYKSTTTTPMSSSSSSSSTVWNNKNKNNNGLFSSTSSSSTSTTKMTRRMEENRGLNGFDPDDMKLYIPIAESIERECKNNSTNISMEEKINIFRSSPELREHFQMKIASLLIQPMKDVQEMDTLRRQYLTSSSRVEKESIKRRIDTLQSYMDKEDMNGGGLSYSDTIHYKQLKPLTDTERRQRIQAVSELPPILQALYKKRNNLDYDDDIELAIELDYYEQQIQLLEQVKYYIGPLSKKEKMTQNKSNKDRTVLSSKTRSISTDNDEDLLLIQQQEEQTQQQDEDKRCQDVVLAIESLPIKARDYVAQTIGLIPGNYTIDDMVTELSMADYDDNDDADDTDDTENGDDDDDNNNNNSFTDLTSFVKNNIMFSQISSIFQNNDVTVSNNVRKERGTVRRRLQNKEGKYNRYYNVDNRNNGDINDKSDESLSDVYNDIGFIDRSRYIDEFYPSIARMEGMHPSKDTIHDFVSTIIDKKIFMVTSKPERVVGGWYIRGRNLLDDDTDPYSSSSSSKLNSIRKMISGLGGGSGSGTDGAGGVGLIQHHPSQELVQRLQRSLESNSKYKDTVQFFYIPDPAPLTDEDFEMDYASEPILVVTAKDDPETFYDYSTPLTKGIINILGLTSILFVGVAATALQPAVQVQWDEIVNAAGGVVTPSSTSLVDVGVVAINSAASMDGSQVVADSTSLAPMAADKLISQLSDMVLQIFQGMLAIHVAHEIGHRFIAWKDKFELGAPTLVPSIQLGLLGTITPFKTPPPSLKSMFDVAIMGPLVGFAVSLALLTTGLVITSNMDINQLSTVPVFPSYLLRASELGGSLIEYFLGKGSITQGPTDSLLPLHPLAIAGFCGIVSNALALLPLGNTDGGRISIAMFGRRGSYIVKTFTAILLVMIGVFGMDESRILLLYLIYTQFWQRELEIPAVNEVEELDFVRGAIGIVTALLVALTLIPMQ